MKSRGPKRSARRAGALGEQEHHDRRRQRRQAGLQRRVARDLLEEEHEEEERDAQPAVHGERLEVPHREVAPPEQLQREHRARRAALVHDEGGEQRDAEQRRHATPAGCPSRPRAGGSARSRARPGRAR